MTLPPFIFPAALHEVIQWTQVKAPNFLLW
jgi:hypothetical protein